MSLPLEFNLNGSRVPLAPAAGASVEAKALAEITDYLLDAPVRSYEAELAMRDAFVYAYRLGYRRGGRDALASCTALATSLADRSFRLALQTLMQFLDGQEAADR